MAASKNAERTFIMVKPDGVQRGLIGDIVHRFEKRGYKMVAGKMMKVIFAIECGMEGVHGRESVGGGPAGDTS